MFIFLISCIWCLALPCHLLRLDMLCVNASCLLSISDMWIMQCHVFQPVIIYVNYAPPCSQASYMWIISCHLFFITYSICRQSVYIELLFMCISHLSRLWKNLEWKQGLQSRQWYLLKHISRWLQGAPQRRIQRQMTSPISHLRCML